MKEHEYELFSHIGSLRAVAAYVAVSVILIDDVSCEHVMARFAFVGEVVLMPHELCFINKHTFTNGTRDYSADSRTYQHEHRKDQRICYACFERRVRVQIAPFSSVHRRHHQKSVKSRMYTARHT